MFERTYKRHAKIALFAVGHPVYWDQFPGLLENLNGFHEVVKDKISANEVEIADFGMVDSSIKAFEVAKEINAFGADIIMCNMVTYATSSVFTPILQNTRIPIVLLALQPLDAMDYMKANTFMQLENDSICSVPEFVSVSIRFNHKVSDVIIGTLHNDKEAEKEISDWCNIAKVLNGLKGARLGMMGHILEAMYDMHTDPAMIAKTFGVHTPLLEIDDLVECYEEVTEKEIQDLIKVINEEFLMPDPVSDPLTSKLTKSDLEEAARGAAALNRLVAKHKLNGLAYFYKGNEGTIQRRVVNSLIVGNSILNAEGIPMSGEYDIKTNVGMFIMDRLDIGGSFAEFHPFDFKDNAILVGHDGPHHIKIAEGKPILRSLSKYHGKPGGGASIEFKIKEGPITMLGVTQTETGAFKFVIAEGYSQNGPIPPTGNTNTRGVFPPNTKDFVKRWIMEGPTHHFALGVGHHAHIIEKIAKCLNIESVIVK